MGDFVQGGTLGAVSKGEYIVNLMNKVGYDAVALGNHEFDYQLPRLNELNAMSNTKFISCNFQKIGEDKSDFEPYTIVSYGSVDVAYIAITTPETTNSSEETPKISLSVTSLSSSGTDPFVSHFEMDCRDTSRASDRSPRDMPFSVRSL